MGNKRYSNFVAIGLIIASLIATGIVCLINSNNIQSTHKSEAAIFRKDGTIALPPGAVSIGVRDIDTNRAYDLNEVLTPTNGKLRAKFNFNQNIGENKEYAFHVFVNGIQRSFIIGQEEFLSYPFSISQETGLSVVFEVDTNEKKDRDIVVVVYQKPNHVEISEDIFDVLNIGDPFFCKYLLYTDANMPVGIEDSSEELLSLKQNNNSSASLLFLDADLDEETILPSAESGQKIYAILHNNNDYELVFALGVLLDWEQLSFVEGEPVKYLKVPANSTKAYELVVPFVETHTPYQVYAVPYGFKYLNINSFISNSLRMIAIPN